MQRRDPLGIYGRIGAMKPPAETIVTLRAALTQSQAKAIAASAELAMAQAKASAAEAENLALPCRCWRRARPIPGGFGSMSGMTGPLAAKPRPLLYSILELESAGRAEKRRLIASLGGGIPYGAPTPSRVNCRQGRVSTLLARREIKDLPRYHSALRSESGTVWMSGAPPCTNAAISGSVFGSSRGGQYGII